MTTAKNNPRLPRPQMMLYRIFFFFLIALFHNNVLLTESTSSSGPRWWLRSLQNNNDISYIQQRILQFRGGDSDTSSDENREQPEPSSSSINSTNIQQNDNDDEDEIPETTLDNSNIVESMPAGTATSSKIKRRKSKRRRESRHTSDMIEELKTGSSYLDDESISLRELITSRTDEYIMELKEAVLANDKKLPHPRKLLHYLAPKVPAIKQSPDVNLRIHSSDLISILVLLHASLGI